VWNWGNDMMGWGGSPGWGLFGLAHVLWWVLLVLGVVVLEAVAEALPPEAEFFRDPHVDLRVAISATVLLVVAGAFAGFFPARRAASIQSGMPSAAHRK